MNYMKKVFIAGIVIVAIFIVALRFIPLGIEPLTELYFEDHTNLPSSVSLGEAENFSFTVHNLEYQKMRYNYSVDFYSENDTFVNNLEKGVIILEQNESKTVDEFFTMRNDFNRTKVVVRIDKDLSLENPKFKDKLWWPDPNYPMSIDIHFWIEEKK